VLTFKTIEHLIGPSEIAFEFRVTWSTRSFPQANFLKTLSIARAEIF
jgi:hypothetical protein